MRESPTAVAVWRTFCDGVTHGRVDRFDDVVSRRAHLVLGTAPGEHVTDRQAMRYGFETEGVSLVSASPEGFEEGTVAWVVDTPRFGFPDGTGVDCRTTVVLLAEDETWRIVHAHFSVGVPDAEVVELQSRWATSGQREKEHPAP
jgi:hypothetical protein